jgi:hypothetical protein
MPHASPGDGGRNESNFLVCFAFFFPLGAPSLASPRKDSTTLQPGPFSNPHSHLRPTRPSGLPDSEAIKSKREGAVRCAPP